MISVWDTISAHIQLPRMVLSTDYLFWKKNIAQVTSDLYMRFTYYTKDWISRGVPGLATDSPCSVWGLGWITCILYDDPFLGLGFLLLVGVKVWYSFAYNFPLKLIYSWYCHFP